MHNRINSSRSMERLCMASKELKSGLCWRKRAEPVRPLDAGLSAALLLRFVGSTPKHPRRRIDPISDLTQIAHHRPPKSACAIRPSSSGSWSNLLLNRSARFDRSRGNRPDGDTGSTGSTHSRAQFDCPAHPRPAVGQLSLLQNGILVDAFAARQSSL